MRLLKLVCASLMLFAAWSARAATESPKLAVLPTVASLTPMADLLTVPLSTLGGVTLLEREQIQKIFREQELGAGQRHDFVKLGRLLNADGLLSLERARDGTNEVLAVRLIAVRPGVVLAEHRFLLPLDKLPEWGKSYASQLERLLPKLAVKPDDALPLSLLNLRSSVSTLEGTVLEQELTTLLQFRLTREPAVFVLERRRMEEMQTEKALSAREPEPFWNGAYLLEGIINREVVSRETVTVHARLSPPGGVPINLEVSGRRDRLGLIVDELTRKILAALNKSPAPAAWQAEAEAEKFLQEAVWAWSWGLHRRVMEAADASWALGKHSPRTAAYRVASRAWTGFNKSYSGSAFPPPDPESLTWMAQALEIYRDSFIEFGAETNAPGIAWGSVGLDLLLAAARVLDRYQGFAEYRQGHEEELSRVRGLAREINDLLSTHRHFGPIGWERNHENLPPLPFNFVFKSPVISGLKITLSQAWLDAGGVWFEKPADALQLYQNLLSPEVYPGVRDQLLTPIVPLVAWSVTQREELPSVWITFLRTMAASTNAQIRLDGLRLILEQSVNPDELEVTARRFAEAAWEARTSIFRRELGTPVVPILSNLVQRVANWGRPAVDPLRALADDWGKRYTNALPDLCYLDWKQLVSFSSTVSLSSYSVKIPTTSPRAEQVQELVALFEAVERERGARGPAKHYRMELKRLAGLPNDVGGRTNPPSLDRRVALKISSRWSLADLRLPPDRGFPQRPSLRNMVWHKDRLWMETQTLKTGSPQPTGRPALVAWDPRTMQAELLEAPLEEAFSLSYLPRRTLLVGDEIFLCSNDELWHRESQGQWRRTPVPAGGLSVPYAWGKQIVLSAEHSILQVDPVTDAVRILASTRRTPPVTALDQVNALGKASLAVWPDGKLRALAGGKVWAYDPVPGEWAVVTAATNCGEILELQSAGIFCRQPTPCGPLLLGGWRPGSSAMEYYTWQGNLGVARGGQITPFTPPYWVHPQNCFPHQNKAVFDGPDLWLFPVPATWLGTVSRSQRSLCFFDRRHLRPQEVRLEFAGPAAADAAAFDGARDYAFGTVEFLPTPAGLAILLVRGGILLWAPKSDLAVALAEATQSDPQPERAEMAALRRFDRDQNGWLDDVERLAMRRDSAWHNGQQAALATSRESADAARRAEWDARFERADKDHDGKLSRSELSMATGAHRDFFADHLRGVNGGIGQLIRPYDLNDDSALDRGEFRAFLADPRPASEVNRSLDWVTRFGLKPEQCDANANGILDDDEWLEVDRLIRARTGARGQKKP